MPRSAIPEHSRAASSSFSNREPASTVLAILYFFLFFRFVQPVRVFVYKIKRERRASPAFLHDLPLFSPDYIDIARGESGRRAAHGASQPTGCQAKRRPSYMDALPTRVSDALLYSPNAWLTPLPGIALHSRATTVRRSSTTRFLFLTSRSFNLDSDLFSLRNDAVDTASMLNMKMSKLSMSASGHNERY